MTLEGPHIPNDENVTVAWLRRFVAPDLGNAGIATALPTSGELPADGFVTARSTNAGIAPIDLPTHHSLVAIDTWAPTRAGGARVQWNAAFQLAQRIIRATESERQMFAAQVAPGADYMTAVVFAVYRDNEPRRVPDDPSGYARYTFDLTVDWAIA